MPRELTATIATTDGSRDIAIDGIGGMIEVETAEYPLEQFPPAIIGFSVWGSVLSLHSPAEPDGDDAKLYYTAVAKSAIVCGSEGGKILVEVEPAGLELWKPGG